ncbi:hypothetical protein TNCV_3080991 [Trichonephila clavipes]|nr:hypothetical protein TNCV_3080991 [Trichonephila clavipes]
MALLLYPDTITPACVSGVSLQAKRQDWRGVHHVGSSHTPNTIVITAADSWVTWIRVAKDDPVPFRRSPKFEARTRCRKQCEIQPNRDLDFYR